MQLKLVVLDGKIYTKQFGLSRNFNFFFCNKMLKFVSYKSIFAANLTREMDENHFNVVKVDLLL